MGYTIAAVGGGTSRARRSTQRVPPFALLWPLERQCTAECVTLVWMLQHPIIGGLGMLEVWEQTVWESFLSNTGIPLEI